MVSQSYRTTYVTTSATPQRTVGFLLGLGILLAPYLFSWALLRNGYSTLARVVSFGWCLIVLIGVYSTHLGKRPSEAASQASQSMAVKSGSASLPASATVGSKDASKTAEASAQTWQYETTKDEMRGTTSSRASVVSTNQLDFAFPYHGGSSGKLLLRRKDGELSVMIFISKGQFTCFDYQDDKVAMKFDAGPVLQYACSRADDGRTDVIFISPEQEILERLRKSKRLTVEAQFFQAGRQQLTFDTAGLNW